MNRALITGITGFTGTHLTKYLSGLGVEIYGIALPPEKIDREQYPEGISKIYYVDIRDETSVSEVIHEVKPDYLFHLAGSISGKTLKDLLEINVIGTRNVMSAIPSSDVKVFIPGSAAEYGRVPEDRLPISEDAPLYPISNYGISKVAQTLLGYHYYLNYGCQLYRARVFNITGPGEPANLVCSTIARQIADIKRSVKDHVIHIGNMETKRDFVDVRDVVRAYWAIIDNGEPGEIYNICSGKPHSIREIIEILSKISKVDFDIEQDSDKVRAVDIPVHVGDNKKIIEHTGWQPEIEFQKTLKDLLGYYLL